jgi:hypothetical protein
MCQNALPEDRVQVVYFMAIYELAWLPRWRLGRTNPKMFNMVIWYKPRMVQVIHGCDRQLLVPEDWEKISFHIWKVASWYMPPQTYHLGYIPWYMLSHNGLGE